MVAVWITPESVLVCLVDNQSSSSKRCRCPTNLPNIKFTLRFVFDKESTHSRSADGISYLKIVEDFLIKSQTPRSLNQRLEFIGLLNGDVKCSINCPTRTNRLNSMKQLETIRGTNSSQICKYQYFGTC